MVTKTEAIKNFLEISTYPDLAGLYNRNMEVHVWVEQDGGEFIEGEYNGKKWHGWTDGLQTWKQIRIPYNGNSDPFFKDTPMNFDLMQHAAGIGMTGWDWENKVSKWVGFDFDALTGHSDSHTKKLTDEQLQEVINLTYDVPWVTIRKSTSGKGLHLYVFTPPIPTNTHNDHATLARSILSTLSGLVGVDLSLKVDSLGYVLWQWHRKMIDPTDPTKWIGLQLIKQATEIVKVDPDWLQHLQVTTKRPGATRARPSFVAKMENPDKFDAITSNYPTNDEHRKLMKHLDGKGWWYSDYRVFITHTVHLKEAHTTLSLKGTFETISDGSDLNSPNCYMIPIHNGSWIVRRYTPGVAESPTWGTDNSGWTRTYYNCNPDFTTACRTYGGIKQDSGGYIFKHAEEALKAANLLGSNPTLPTWALGRSARLRESKHDKSLVMNFTADKQTDTPSDLDQIWYMKGKEWECVLNQIESPSDDTENYDELVRHLVSNTGDDSGWVLRSKSEWREEPFLHIKTGLKGKGYNTKEVEQIMGNCINQPWVLVNEAFKSEYLKNRNWNRNAAQYSCEPSPYSENLSYPTWTILLNHWGHGLDLAIKEDDWCQSNNIYSGADYLKVWIASLFQFPSQPLPYLFFYSPEENSGKSTFHESLSLLVTKGVVRADNALVNQSGFNGELFNAFLCVVEEVDLQKSRVAYARIKDWVTSEKINIHIKGRTPFDMLNTTHFVQSANNQNDCPIHVGDSRITMIRMHPIETIIPRRELQPLLKSEAPDFLSELLNLPIPQSYVRLNVPIITTEEKHQIAQSNRTLLEIFIDENTYRVDGKLILFAEFCERFHNWIEKDEKDNWKKIKIGRELPFPRGRLTSSSSLHIGNISWDKGNGEKLPPLILKGDTLIPTKKAN